MVRVRRACKVEECCNWAKAYGFCGKHLMRWKRHGHTDSTRSKDWGQREKHPLYGIWTWRRRKDKSCLCPEWHNDFWKFVSDVGKSPGGEFRLQRVDKRKLYSVDNFEWAEKRFAQRRSETSKQYARRYQRAYRKSDYGKRALRNRSLKKMYGITIEVYEAILEYQKGTCAICGQKETAIHHVTKEVRELAVDHCHETGKVRGLLCHKCKISLGSFRDSREILQMAIKYLDDRR